MLENTSLNLSDIERMDLNQKAEYIFYINEVKKAKAEYEKEFTEKLKNRGKRGNKAIIRKDNVSTVYEWNLPETLSIIPQRDKEDEPET